MSSGNTSLPPLPANHLSHPENWTTGSEPITSNQEGFIKVLQGQHPDLVPESGVDTSSLSKSDASDVIDKLKKGEKLDESINDPENHVEAGGKPAAADSSEKEDLSSSKRKQPTRDEADQPASLEAAQAETEGEATTGQSSSNGVTTDSGEVKPAGKAEEEDARPAKKAKTEKEGEDAADEVAEVAEGETAEDPIEVDTPPNETIATPAEPSNHSPKAKANGNGEAKKADAAEETTPGDEAHLDHPENWATGDQPATDKQKGFIKVLEKQKGAEGVVGDVESLGKSEASEKIDELKKM